MLPNRNRRTGDEFAAKRARVLLVTWVLLMLPPAIGLTQEFSADVVFTPLAKQSAADSARPSVELVRSARLYVNKQQMRLESQGVTGETLVVDDAHQTTVALFPSDKTYQALRSRPQEYFRVTDAERACPDWQQALGGKIDCGKIGRETVDGRRSVKYQRHSADGSAEYVWIDRKLNFVIKWQIGQIEAQLHNIKEGSQSAELFTVPKDYRPLTPRKSKPRVR